jgi:hypothetical protein
MTKLHFNYKDTFRALRLGFSAKKIWMMSLGLLVGFAGYTTLTYLAFVAAGVDILTVWQQFRLLPFPSPFEYPFPWFAWVIYGVAAAFLLTAFLVTGTAVSRVCFEQLKGDEFYESREAFKFAFKHAGSVVYSPLLIVGFVAIVVACGLGVSGLGAIPYVGDIIVGVFSPVAFIASLFIVYLTVALVATLFMAPSVVGASRSDTFDTLFEVFSCVNEQPGRLVWYTATTAALAKAGAFLFGLAASAAGRISYSILLAFMGDKLPDTMGNAAFYFKVALPDWWPALAQRLFVLQANLYGLPQMYLPSDYLSIGWNSDIAALLIAITMYLVALMVLGFGCSVWFCGMTLNYAVLAHKKDNRSILDVPSELEELIEPVAPTPEAAAQMTEPDNRETS